MRAFERAILWIGVIALAITTLVINGRVGNLKTTVQDHTATLDKPVLDAAVFPGVPAAFSERWNKATAGKNLTPQDHLWLTVQITNAGQTSVEALAAELSLLPAISAVYPYSEGAWSVSKVAEGGQGMTWVKIIFPSLSQGDAHTVFIALRPEDFDGPPYEAQDKRQWTDQHRLYWKTLTITVEDKTTLVRYGLASHWMPVTQQAAKQ